MNKLEQSFRNLNLIFNSLLISQIIIGLGFSYLLRSGLTEPVITDFAFLPLVVLAVNTAIILAAKYLFTRRTKIDLKLSLEEKISEYKKLSLVIILLIEAANIFNLLIYLLNGSTIYLWVAVLILFLYFIYRPAANKFAETSFTDDERKHILIE